MKKIFALAAVLCIAIVTMLPFGGTAKGNYIKYVEFDVTYKALEEAMKLDIESHDSDVKLCWTDLLSYLGAKYGGDFSRYRSGDLNDIAKRLQSGEKLDDITRDMQYYSYFHEAYTAALGGLVGEYTEYDRDENGKKTQVERYGLKAYSPIAATFPYSHYDDFGVSRSYGYARRHLGHDMMAATGTPVVAVEGGVVECMGWNQYGGWRIGIRSHDKKRYYYYAHLRKNRPYHCDLKEGMTVEAGDVIGYVGRTGYSANENVNGIETSHLHIGLELIFDESQKESDNEIWIDLYAITKLLEKNKSKTWRNAETKEFYSQQSLIRTNADKNVN